MGKIKTLVITTEIRARVALVRRAADLAAVGALDYSAYELAKIELADTVIEQVARQEHRTARLASIPRAAVPVVDVSLRRKARA